MKKFLSQPTVWILIGLFLGITFLGGIGILGQKAYAGKLSATSSVVQKDFGIQSVGKGQKINDNAGAGETHDKESTSQPGNSNDRKQIQEQSNSNGIGKESNDKESKSPLGKSYEVLNGVLAIGAILSGPLMLYPALRRRWTKPIHLVLEGGYIILFGVSLALTKGSELAAGAVEWYNILLITVLSITATLFLWKPKSILKNYRFLMATHVIAGTMFAVKFLAEPLLGGKFG